MRKWRGDSYYEQVGHHQSCHQPVHRRPVVVVHQRGCGYVGHLHAAQYHDMQHWEKHSEVAVGRQPQLYGRHALKRSLYLAHALDEAHCPQQRQKRYVRGGQVAGHHARGGRCEQRLVGKPELHPEQNREVDGHSRQVGVEAHEQVFAHHGRLAHHLGHGAEVQSARQLERHGHEYVKPRLQPARHSAAHHGHGERPVGYRCFHVSASLYIPR